MIVRGSHTIVNNLRVHDDIVVVHETTPPQSGFCYYYISNFIYIVPIEAGREYRRIIYINKGQYIYIYIYRYNNTYIACREYRRIIHINTYK